MLNLLSTIQNCSSVEAEGRIIHYFVRTNLLRFLILKDGGSTQNMIYGIILQFNVSIKFRGVVVRELKQLNKHAHLVAYARTHVQARYCSNASCKRKFLKHATSGKKLA